MGLSSLTVVPMARERLRHERNLDTGAAPSDSATEGDLSDDRASVAWFKLFQAAPIGIARVSLDGRFQSVNRALCEMFGYSAAWLLAADIADLNHPDDNDVARANISRLSSDAAAEVRVEKRYVHADGHVVWAHVNAVPITVDGVIDHIIAFYVDITERRETEAQLLASEAELRTVQQALPDAVQVFRQDGTLSYRNAAAEWFYELAPEERTTDIVAARWELLRQDASVMPIEEGPLATAMRTGQASERVVVGIRERPGKTVRWLSISTVPIRRPGAEPPGMCPWPATSPSGSSRFESCKFSVSPLNS
jgi:PAS domain S-box-containing protein